MAHPLDPLFSPASVALVGASERTGSIGAAVLGRLREGGFQGPIRLVNPKYTELAGERCYASLADLPEAVDLAVIAAPAATVPAIVKQARDARTRALVVLSAGFAESGDAGIALQRELVREVRAADIAGTLNALYGRGSQAFTIASIRSGVVLRPAAAFSTKVS